MIKNDGWIHRFGSQGGIEPFDPEAVNPASYDISLGNQVLLPQQMLDVSIQREPYLLMPGETCLVVSNETIKTPNDIAITVRLKRSLGRQIIVAPMGLFVDPGYVGQLTFALVHMGTEPYELRLGRRVAQLIFNQLTAPAVIPYGDERRISHYQNSQGVIPNKSTL
jgi:dCTP deaminase